MERKYTVELVCNDADPRTEFRYTWALSVGGKVSSRKYSTDDVLPPVIALEKVLANPL